MSRRGVRFARGAEEDSLLGRLAPGQGEAAEQQDHPLLALQASAGNQAVKRYLSSSAALTGRATPGNGATSSRLQRQPADPGGQQHGSVGGDLSGRAHAFIAKTDEVSKRLTEFANGASTEYGEIRESVKGYLENYRAAYDDFAKKLGEASEAAERSRKIADAFMEIFIAVGVGMGVGAVVEGLAGLIAVADVSPELYPSARALISEWSEEGPHTATELVSHTAGKVVEMGVVAGIDAVRPAAPLDVPPEFSADRQAAENWEKLEGVAFQLVKLMPAIVGFGNYRVALERAVNAGERSAASKGAHGSSDHYKAFVEETERNDLTGKMAMTLDAATLDFNIFNVTARTPLLERSKDEILDELWIRKMAELGPAGPDAFAGNDTIMEELKARNLIKGGKGEARLDVDEGDFESEGGTKPFELAAVEKYRLDEVGRLGVVVVPPDDEGERGFLADRRGAICISSEAYVGTLRRLPEALFEQRDFFPIAGEGFKAGDVVMVTGTRGGELDVRLAGPPRQEVSREDRRSGLATLGFIPDEVEAREEEKKKLAEAGAKDAAADPWATGPSWPDTEVELSPATVAILVQELGPALAKKLGFVDNGAPTADAAPSGAASADGPQAGETSPIDPADETSTEADGPEDDNVSRLDPADEVTPEMDTNVCRQLGPELAGQLGFGKHR